MRDRRQSASLRVGILAYGLDRPASGIGRYVLELVGALAAHRAEVQVVVLQPFSSPIPGLEDRLGVEYAVLPGASRLLPGMMTLGPAVIAAAAHRHRLDVVHDPVGIAPFLPRRLGRFARVVTIHDAIPFRHPETHPWLTNALFRHYIPRTLRFVDQVVTVSDASKRDLERFYGLHPSRVERIYNGIGPLFGPLPAGDIARVAASYGIERPYLLTVGALQARKNIESAFAAFARLRAAGLPHRLVVVGNKAWKTAGLFRRLEELALGDAVSLTGYVADADLPALYAGAECFVFPSLYEGFGLPPLEAMACGTPVVVANTSSLPEVVGEAGLLVPPTDVEAIAAAVEQVVTEPALAAALRRRGRDRARLFTWERSAAEHAAVYGQLAGAGRR